MTTDISTRYISTRGAAPKVEFREALLAGLAPDGGLYVPEIWPRLDEATLRGFDGAPFAAVAGRVLAAFSSPWLDAEEATALAEDAYASFAEPEIVAPLAPLSGDLAVLELFHGPTLAFKDVAMQLIARLFERALRETGDRVTIVGATSGDTGGAAVAAFAGRPNVDLFVLYPEGRISAVQRRFMTSSGAANVRALAVAGTFDDCQAIVKALFADRDFVVRKRLSGINSINWARLAIQASYYFSAAAALRMAGDPRRPSFAVPTGNFGDAFAGYIAKRLGLSAGPILCAVNANDILHRALTTGRYAPRKVVQTQAPSMDIEVASNFERLLFEASGRDAAAVTQTMQRLAEQGRYDIPEAWRAAMGADFLSESVSEAERTETMKAVYAAHGMVLDPHTAIAVSGAQRLLAARPSAAPVIALATAHPAKFPDAIQATLGRDMLLPDRLSAKLSGPEHAIAVPDDVSAVKSLLNKALA